MTTTQNITAFLDANGFGYKRDGRYLVLTGEWISDYSRIVFDAEAAVETAKDGQVYKVSDLSGDYRLEIFAGSGPNGLIADWEVRSEA
jgi:hypothetical protein